MRNKNSPYLARTCRANERNVIERQINQTYKIYIYIYWNENMHIIYCDESLKF